MIDFFYFICIFTLALVLAKGFGALCKKVQLPPLIGEIGAGIFIANFSFGGLLTPSIRQSLITSPLFVHGAELGIIFLLFLVGLESNLTDLLKAGTNSLITATLGVVFPLIGGAVVAHWLFDLAFLEVWLIGATFAATSIGITAKLLSDYKKISTPSAQIILGAAVIDDVMGLIILALIGSIATSNTISWGILGVILLKVFLFFGVAVFVGHFLIPSLFKAYHAIKHPILLTILLIAIALSFSHLATFFGLASIIGAFTAGLLLDEVKIKSAPDLTVKNLEEIIHPITHFLLPCFFISIGLKVSLAGLHDFSTWTMILSLLTIALLGKSICGLFCYGKNIDRLGIGFGMIPRGEVGLIFATFGLNQNIISAKIYAVLILVVLLTTLIGPLALRLRVKKF